MSKPLLYYCGSKKDELVFRKIEKAIETMSSAHKLDLAFLTLCSLLEFRGLKRPLSIPVPGIIHDEILLANKLSYESKLDLVTALIEQVRQS